MADMLSQEEIDVLLSGALNKQKPEVPALSAEEMDALTEISNVSMNSAANTLFSILKKKVSMTCTDLSVAEEEEAKALFSTDTGSLEVALKGAYSDKVYYVFDVKDLYNLSDLLLGGEGETEGSPDFDEMHTNVVVEGTKDVFVSAVNAIGSMVNQEIDTFPPKLYTANTEEVSGIIGTMLVATYTFEVGNVIHGEIKQVMPVSLAKKQVKSLLQSMGIMDEPEPQPVPVKKEPEKKAPAPSKGAVKVKPVSYPTFDDDNHRSPYGDSIDFIMDVPLQVTVELGKTKKLIKDILNLNVGSIVELDKLAGDNVDILVNGKLIARGEVIVIDENFGVRIMEIFTHNQKSIMKF